MKLSSFEKIDFIGQPTPLLQLKTLSAQHNKNLWVKRDDLNGVGSGGNKVRKLEYLLADAVNKGATSIITGGGIQSNHAAATAICASRLGLKTYLSLTESVPLSDSHFDLHYNENGNVLLNNLCGATIKRFPKGSSTNDCIASYAEEIKHETGISPYEIVMGGSSALGALGYVNAALEISEQLKIQGITEATILHASGSAGTQAGLTVGAALSEINLKVTGCSVLYKKPILTDMVEKLCIDISTLLELDKHNWTSDIFIIDDYIGDGYGIPSASTWKSIKTGIDKESLICDPCYTGKAFNCFLDLAASTSEDVSANAIFLMTGGLIGMMGYQRDIQSLSDVD